MKKLLFTVLITVLSHFSLKAQKEFMSGYVVNNTGDTIRGKIDNKKWATSPLKITFKKDDQEVSYGLSDVQSFVINNEVTYVRKKISLDITPNTSTELLQKFDRVLVDTTLLLKQLVKGRLSLYYLKDGKDKIHYFIEKLNNPIQELIDHRFLRTINFKTYEVHLDTYNQQLYDLCEDCSNYSGTMFKYLYQETDLIPLVMRYNIFFGDNKPIQVSRKEKFKSTFFLSAALGTYNYNIEGAVFYYTNDYKKADLKSASFGIGGLFDLPSKRHKLGVKIDLSYNYFEEDIQFYQSTLTPSDVSFLGVSIGPQYSFYKNEPKKTDIYLSSGFSFEKRLNANKADFFYEGLGDKLGYKLGLGAKFNRINVELSYNRTGPGLNINYYVAGNIQKVSLALSYALGKNK